MGKRGKRKVVIISPILYSISFPLPPKQNNSPRAKKGRGNLLEKSHRDAVETHGILTRRRGERKVSPCRIVIIEKLNCSTEPPFVRNFRTALLEELDRLGGTKAVEVVLIKDDSEGFKRIEEIVTSAGYNLEVVKPRTKKH